MVYRSPAAADAVAGGGEDRLDHLPHPTIGCAGAEDRPEYAHGSPVGIHPAAGNSLSIDSDRHLAFPADASEVTWEACVTSSAVVAHWPALCARSPDSPAEDRDPRGSFSAIEVVDCRCLKAIGVSWGHRGLRSWVQHFGCPARCVGDPEADCSSRLAGWWTRPEVRKPVGSPVEDRSWVEAADRSSRAFCCFFPFY